MFRRALRRFAFAQMPMDVLDHDDRVVDDEADGDRKAAHRHEIDRAVRQVQDEERADDRQRQRRRRNEGRSPITQEREQDEHGEEAADDDRLAHALDRVHDERRQIVDLGDPDRRRQRRQVVAQRLLDAVGDVEDVATYLARDVDVGRGQSVARDERRPIDHALAHLRDVADVHGRLLPEGHHHVADVLEADDILAGARFLRDEAKATSIATLGFSMGGRSVVKAMIKDRGQLLHAGISLSGPIR